MTAKSVTVKIPASTSNLGSGFDTLGLAVKLYNRVRVTRVSREGCKIVSSISEEDAVAARAMIGEAVKLFFGRTRLAPFGCEISIKNEIPIARGLGFSATVRIGVIVALHELAGRACHDQEVLDWSTELEGHPDNVAPSLFGGFTVSGLVDRRVRCLRFPVSSKAKLITLIPPLKIATEQARTLIPSTFSKSDTVHALNRAALITAAFARGDYRALRGLFDDRVHQPFREQLIPQLSRVIQAGARAGAIGGWLSGSGSAIMCLALSNSMSVAEAMRKQLPDAQLHFLTADNQGLSVLKG
jgi:homoserine kinase